MPPAVDPSGRACSYRARAVIACHVSPWSPHPRSGSIRALDGVDTLLSSRRQHVVAVSPIVAGAALKGPADRMLRELGMESTVVGVAELYADVASVLVIDRADAELAGAVEHAGMRCIVMPTVMSTVAAAEALAVACVNAVR